MVYRVHERFTKTLATTQQWPNGCHGQTTSVRTDVLRSVYGAIRRVCAREVFKNWYGKAIHQESSQAFSISNGLNMKISRSWLQTFFEKPLPEAQTLADALTFHAFEIESIDVRGVTSDKVLDVKVTPNRGHDCLSYRGIAKEISAILNLPLVPHPYGITSMNLEPKTDALKVTVENPELCPRFSAAYIR